MNALQIKPPTITIRVPGLWEDRSAFERSLPADYALHGDGARLITPEGEIGFGVNQADDELAGLIADASKHEPSARDREILENHIVKVFLSCEGGSVEAASRMLRVGAAILRAAGGGGVFVDNSGAGHCSSDWFDLAGSAGEGGEYWAYMITAGDRKRLWTIGMHVLGHRDAIMERSDDEEFDFLLMHNFLGYSYRSGQTLHDGDLFGDPFSPWYRAHMVEARCAPEDSPMHNPYGMWRLEMVEPDEDLTPQSLRN